MAMVGMRDVCWGFSEAPLLENVTFWIEKGERVCLVGRNGTGKTTLLKLLSGEMLPDSGDIWRQPDASVAALMQDVPAECDGTVFEVVAAGFAQAGRMPPMPAAGDDRELSTRVNEILSRTRLEPGSRFADLSAGLKRRTLFARALVRQPDLLLLDEPTNHLDIDTIIWMEELILRHVKTLLFVTHDRTFLTRVAGRILELDRGRLLSYDCDYVTYLVRRQGAWQSEETQNRVFDKKLSQEEAWIRKGIKARRTRNEGRVRSLEQMRADHRARRRKIGNVRLQVQEAERSGRLVIEARAVNFSYGATPLVRDFSLVVMRGDRVGIIGPNGAGKTTLLKILLKAVDPQTGSVRHGTNLQIVYFDQLRAQLDEQKSVRENIAAGNDFILFNGQKRHVISYLQDFLFSAERCRTPVGVLSGGEKNRLLLARIFTQPANVLVLDEPTNDLDVETLELLEEQIFEYPGTLLLVSHDRAFLNNVVTSTIVFEGRGQVVEYPGGYDDWLSQRPPPAGQLPEKTPRRKSRPESKARPAPKLGYMQMRELQGLPQKIEALEAEQKKLFAILSDPLFYKKEKEAIVAVKENLARVQQEIEAAYRRWDELEKIQSQAGP